MKSVTPAEYAEALATSLHDRFYQNQKWEPLRGDIIGLLTQIDNMTTGLHDKIERQQETIMLLNAKCKDLTVLLDDALGTPCEQIRKTQKI